MANGIRLKTIGRIQDLPDSCKKALETAVTATAKNSSTTLVLALSYSARAEIVDAVKTLCLDAATGQLQPESVDAALISSRLYTSDMPDPDLLIRTSGEMRLSNFLLWQLSYTEIVVTQKLWPDFTREDLRAAIDEFQKRHRRFGGV
jgi:undecaprenyl diphosphate synthase